MSNYKSKHTGAQVDEAVSKVLNGEVGGSGGTTPDWNAQPGESGYIENRTHYVTGTGVDLKYKTLDEVYIPDTIARKSDIPVPIIIEWDSIKDYANGEGLNNMAELPWLDKTMSGEYKKYNWAIQKDGIIHPCVVIPDYDNKHIQILYFTRNEIEGTSGPLGNAIMKYSGLRMTTGWNDIYGDEYYKAIYKISNGGSLETREFVFGESYNKNAYLIAAAQMSGIDTIDCKWVYTTKADENITVNGQYFHIENSITNVDAIFSVKDKSLTYVDGNGLINKVTFADNGSYNISKNNPDWNAKEGEAGYIENKPFYAEVDIRQIDVNGDYSINIYDLNIGDKIDISWDLTYYDGEIFRGSTSFVTQEQPTTYYEKDNFYIYGGGAWFEMYAYGMCDPLYGKVTVLVNGEIKTLDDKYIPDTVIKTFPQTLSDTDKNQALANLGIDPVALKYMINPLVINYEDGDSEDGDMKLPEDLANIVLTDGKFNQSVLNMIIGWDGQGYYGVSAYNIKEFPHPTILCGNRIYVLDIDSLVFL